MSSTVDFLIVGFNCPKCGLNLRHMETTGVHPNVTRIYQCPHHGEWVLRPGSELQQARRAIPLNASGASAEPGP